MFRSEEELLETDSTSVSPRSVPGLRDQQSNGSLSEQSPLTSPDREAFGQANGDEPEPERGFLPVLKIAIF